MKKILISVVIFLFAATTASYASFFDNEQEGSNVEHESDSRNGFFSNISSPGNDPFDHANSEGFFRASAGSPGGRPDNGEGIGQQSDEEAPLGEGIYALILCCIVWGFMKGYKNKRQECKPV